MADHAPVDAEVLTPAEETLVGAVIAGRRADLSGQAVRASILRDLASETRADWPLPPVGLSVHNATIEGTLDLEGCTVGKPLVFLRCRFKPNAGADTAIGLRDTQLKRVALYDCTVTGAIKADRAHIESALFLSGSTVTGMVRLRGASIGEALAMDGAKIEASGETCILADGLRLGGPWILRAATIVGGIRLEGARIGGGLLWEEVRIKHASVAVHADGAIADGMWALRRAKIEGALRFRGMHVKAIDAQALEITSSAEGFNGRGADVHGDLILDGARITGETRLGRAHIAGELSARGAVLTGAGEEWAVAAAGVAVDQGIALAGARIKGGISLAGAQIGQGLSASNIEIDGRGRAIEADVMHVRGNWIMRGAKITGSVRFAGAVVEGQLGFTQSVIEGSGDLAIRADGAQVRGGWFMGRADIRGLVRLPAARIGNEMRLRATKLQVASGPALFASGVTIARELVLDGGFTTRGSVVLDHAVIDGTLDLSGSQIASAAVMRADAPRKPSHDEMLDARYDEAAVSLVDARLDRLVMPENANERPRGIVDLSRARVGSYEDAAPAWPPPLSRTRGDVRCRSVDGRDIDHLVLDGFVYDHLENPAGMIGAGRRKGVSAATMRTHWLDGQSAEDLQAHFKPQAWVELSKRLAAQGYHEDAREIAITLRRRHRKSASASRGARLQGWFLDVFALYGFNPWRTVMWMVLVVGLFAGVWALAARNCGLPGCKDEQVFVMALKGNFGQDDAKATANYPYFNPLAYSLDVFLPFIDLGYEAHWRPSPSYGPITELRPPDLPWLADRTLTVTLGGLLYVLYVVEMIIGLVLTSLAITGFTGLLKGVEEPRAS